MYILVVNVSFFTVLSSNVQIIAIIAYHNAPKICCRRRWNPNISKSQRISSIKITPTHYYKHSMKRLLAIYSHCFHIVQLSKKLNCCLLFAQILSPEMTCICVLHFSIPYWTRIMRNVIARMLCNHLSNELYALCAKLVVSNLKPLTYEFILMSCALPVIR